MEYSRLFQIDNDKHDFIMWSRNHYVGSSQNDLVKLVSETLLATATKIPKLPRLVGPAIDIIPSTLGKYIGHGKSARKHQRQFFEALLENDEYYSNLDETIDYFEEIFMQGDPNCVFMFSNMDDDKFNVMVHTMYLATKKLDRIRDQLDDDELKLLECEYTYFNHVLKIRNITRGLAKIKFSELLKEYDENFEREHKWLYMDLLKRHFPDRVRRYLKVSPNIPYYLINHIEVFNAKCAISIDIYQTMSNEEKDEVKSKTWSKKHFEWCKALKEKPYESRTSRSQKRAMTSADKMLSLYYNPVNAYSKDKKYPSEIIDLYKY